MPSVLRFDWYFQNIPTSEGLKPHILQLFKELESFPNVLNHSETNIVFFGAFNTGKSTLINALLKIPLLPVHYNRSTGTVTRLIYSDTPYAIVRHATTNVVERVPFEVGLVATMLDLSRQDSVIEMPLEVTLGVPSPMLKPGVVWVDTPGLFDHETLTQRTIAALENADLAVMVLAADKLMSQYERELAQNISWILNSNVIFVVNRLDLLETNALDDLRVWMNHAVSEMSNTYLTDQHIFYVCARDAMTCIEQQSIVSPQTNIPLLGQFLEHIMTNKAVTQLRWDARTRRLHHLLNRIQVEVQAEINFLDADLKPMQMYVANAVKAQENQVRSATRRARAQVNIMRNRTNILAEKWIQEWQLEVAVLIRSDFDWKYRLETSLEQFCIRKAKEIILQLQLALNNAPMTLPFIKMPLGLQKHLQQLLFFDDPWVVLERLPVTASLLQNEFNTMLKNYLDILDNSLVTYSISYKPVIPWLPYKQELEETYKEYHRILVWCDRFQKEL